MPVAALIVLCVALFGLGFVVAFLCMPQTWHDSEIFTAFEKWESDWRSDPGTYCSDAESLVKRTAAEASRAKAEFLIAILNEGREG